MLCLGKQVPFRSSHVTVRDSCRLESADPQQCENSDDIGYKQLMGESDTGGKAGGALTTRRDASLQRGYGLPNRAAKVCTQVHSCLLWVL